MNPAALVAALRAAGCVFAEDEAEILTGSARSSAELEAMLARRVAGEPLEYIVGWVDFGGLRLAVESGAFVPRQRSQFLVHTASALARSHDLDPVILDLCCGVGALGAAVLADLGEFELHAADVEPVAVRCARRNLEPLGGNVYEGDLFDPLPTSLRGRVTLLLVNAPYVPTDAIALMPPEARDHEPLVTLDGGPDGTDVQRRVIAAAGEWLAPGGHLLIEAGADQAVVTAGLMTAAGLSARVEESEEFYATVVVGTA